jgi:cytosine/adenosine deaminase-related metal-dependent hydrolase
MQRPSKLLVHDGRVVTMDPALGDFERADVRIVDGVIREVGPGLQAGGDFERLDAHGGIVSPGFVDAHRHVWQTQLRTIATDWTLFDYTCRMRFGYSALYRPDDVHLGNLAGALEAIHGGITTLVDHCHIINSPAHADAAVRGLIEAGIRGIFCYGLFPNPTLPDFAVDFEPGWRLEDARRVRDRYFAGEDDLLAMGLAPTEVTARPFEAVCRELAFGREIGAARISCHVGMGRYDRGDRLVERLGRAGALGEDVLLVHGAALTDDELAIVAASGAAIAATPETELQMGMGRPVPFRARDAGVRTGLGIDIVSNYAGDMFGQMRLLLQAERGFRHEASAGPPRRLGLRAREVLELATIGGARALGLADRIGSLTPGKQADLIVTRCDAIHMTPAHDAVGALVLNATAQDVDTVLVAGRPVKRSGALVDVDWPRLAERLDRSGRRIAAGFAAVPLDRIEALVAPAMLVAPDPTGR